MFTRPPLAPDNTIAAFRAAADKGAKWVGLNGVITDNPNIYLG